MGESVGKPVLWNANYDGENIDYTNALRPRRFKWCVFDKFHMILSLMLDTFYLSGFISQVLHKLCFQLPQNIT